MQKGMIAMGRKEDTELSLNESAGSANSSLGEAVCVRPKEYLTKEEAVILADIRELREEVLATKNSLKRLESRLGTETDACETGVASMTHNYQVLTDQLADLRRKRKAFDRLREEAHRRKMVMLGHEDP